VVKVIAQKGGMFIEYYVVAYIDDDILLHPHRNVFPWSSQTGGVE
jgi:hypothetical protein